MPRPNYLQREALMSKIAAGETLSGFSLQSGRAYREAQTATEKQMELVRARFKDELVGRVVPFVISGGERLDDGYAIPSRNWTHDEYDRAPGVLWTHDRWSVRICDSILIDGDDFLRALACFYPRDFSMALDGGRSWAIGELAAFRGYRASVGFEVLEAHLPDEATRKKIPWALDVDLARLREWSILNEGMDDVAISAGRAAGIDVSPLADMFAQMLDEGAMLGLDRAKLERLFAAAAPARARVIDAPEPSPFDWRAELRAAFAG
jgi:hypothetical protein